MWSYSRVKTYEQCPAKYKLRYIDKNYIDHVVETPDDALHLGTCIHYGIETGSVEKAIEKYKSEYPIITFKHEVEIMKLEYWLNELIPMFSGGQHELSVEDDTFRGFIDYMDERGIFDFKYTNQNTFLNYNNGQQLMLYGSLLDEEIPLYYVLIPKILIRQKKSETEEMFLNRLREKLWESEIKIVNIEHDQQLVNELYEMIETIEDAEEFPEMTSKLCEWCDFKNTCKSYQNSIDR